MTISIETDNSGREHLMMTDVPKFRGNPRGIPVENILIRACGGHVFSAPPGLRRLSRLGEAEAEMVEYWLREVDGAREPNIFAGDPPVD